jgi:outer membrane receptor protein involved in Fe transport
MRSAQIIYCLFSAVGLSCLSSTAFTQQDASAPRQAANVADQGIREVVVTAERRSSDVLTTPISMTAISVEQLETQQPENGSWLTQAYVKNVANKTYISGYGGNAVYYGDPHQVGLRVRKSF